MCRVGNDSFPVVLLPVAIKQATSNLWVYNKSISLNSPFHGLAIWLRLRWVVLLILAWICFSGLDHSSGGLAGVARGSLYKSMIYYPPGK